MRILNLTICLALMVTMFPGPAPAETGAAEEPDDQAKPLSFWMEKKMEYSQDMLRGLVSGDLQTVAERAKQMRLVSKVEGWIRGNKSGYRTQLQVFEFANKEILRNARAENLEGTTKAFHQMTASCVSCHKLTRQPNGHPEAPATGDKSVR